jgi:hypothetical protein
MLTVDLRESPYENGGYFVLQVLPNRWLHWIVVMRRHCLQIGLLAATVVFSAGCCSTNTKTNTNSGKVAPYIAVREAQFRSEKSENDRIKLPLSAEDRSRLLIFLRTGGNTQLIGKGIVSPGADTQYSGLLDYLTELHQLSDLTGARPKFFTMGPLYEVVDAREPFSLSDTQVIAMGDGYYWWIFYHPNSKRLEGLLVTRAVGAKPAEN